MTTGAPKIAVVALTGNSIGEKSILARRSHKPVSIAPPKIDTGIRKRLSDVPNDNLDKCGTANPTKPTGPAKAVTIAANAQDKKMMR